LLRNVLLSREIFIYNSEEKATH